MGNANRRPIDDYAAVQTICRAGGADQVKLEDVRAAYRKSVGPIIPTTQEFRTACQGKMHRIILKPRGALVLCDHAGKSKSVATDVMGKLGMVNYCRDILINWRSRVGSGDVKERPTKRWSIPASMYDVCDKARDRYRRRCDYIDVLDRYEATKVRSPADLQLANPAEGDDAGSNLLKRHGIASATIMMNQLNACFPNSRGYTINITSKGRDDLSPAEVSSWAPRNSWYNRHKLNYQWRMSIPFDLWYRLKLIGMKTLEGKPIIDVWDGDTLIVADVKTRQGSPDMLRAQVVQADQKGQLSYGKLVSGAQFPALLESPRATYSQLRGQIEDNGIFALLRKREERRTKRHAKEHSVQTVRPLRRDRATQHPQGEAAYEGLPASAGSAQRAG